MPKYNNTFRGHVYIEETILSEKGGIVGHIRIKPGRVLWKPRGSQQYFSVGLDRFMEWITDPDTKARKVTQ